MEMFGTSKQMSGQQEPQYQSYNWMRSAKIFVQPTATFAHLERSDAMVLEWHNMVECRIEMDAVEIDRFKDLKRLQ